MRAPPAEEVARESSPAGVNPASSSGAGGPNPRWGGRAWPFIGVHRSPPDPLNALVRAAAPPPAGAIASRARHASRMAMPSAGRFHRSVWCPGWCHLMCPRTGAGGRVGPCRPTPYPAGALLKLRTAASGGRPAASSVAASPPGLLAPCVLAGRPQPLAVWRRLEAVRRRPRSRQAHQACSLPASLPADPSHSPFRGQRSEKADYSRSSAALSVSLGRIAAVTSAGSGR